MYKEFINRSRPYKKYEKDVPREIMADLKERHNPKWRYWFFTFKDNKSLSDKDIQKKIDSVPLGTKMYKNKILGLRGRATGLVFPNFERTKHVIKRDAAKKYNFIKFSAGLDTAYSSKSPDTIAMIFQGITEDGYLITLDEQVYNNADLNVPIAPSDTVHKFIAFLDKNRDDWGFARDVFIDSADQATITELNKYKRQFGTIYNFINAYKKMKIIDRINLQIGWIAQGYYLVLEHCEHHIREMESYSWQEDKEVPEDKNDHTINANQYTWLPYKKMIGKRGIKDGVGEYD